MEDVLAVYQGEYDEHHPLICMDETSTQLVAEVRIPIAARPGEAQKYDSAYERNGGCNLLLFSEPLAGQGFVNVSETRTAVDGAHHIKAWVDERYPQVERITLVMDNLNTPASPSLYKAFEPAAARRLLEKLEIHYTPKHGSWLNIAEIELSVLSRQCLDRRIPDRDTLIREVNAWETRRNAACAPVQWRFTTADARVKLKQLYPSIEC